MAKKEQQSQTAGQGAPASPDNVHIGIFDANGVFRHKKVSGAKAAKLAKTGGPFCDVLYSWDTNEEPQETGAFIDRPTAIDPDSMRAYPFAENDALAISDFVAPFGAKSARYQAQAMVDRAANAGFSVHAAFEFEFTVMDETPRSLRKKGYRGLDHFAEGNRTYSLQTEALHHDLLADFEAMMTRLGITLDAMHTELGPGFFEAPLLHAEGLRAADDAALFKNFAKAFFLRNGLTAAFMAKLSPDLPGQSGHLHMSLRKDGAPAFADPDAKDGLSETARHFIGGIVTLMPEMLALCSHTINAYKRMVPGAWAPTWSSWGIQNRTAALRVITDDHAATRIEFRVPAADTNPFAAYAMCLGAGMYGIENGIEPPAPEAGDCYAVDAPEALRLPRTLDEAADRLEASKAAREIFGDDFIDTFVKLRRYEVAAHNRQVGAWELERYLEVV
ncbi:glutamine synthetase [Roseovarius sp. Pro17]|uniref:glutamine synthetase family protein n=1 Tax=Roseovarius sp. Pro17 TaxID=3108175 RepID=UPI002D79601E|nr:glutamine synthetase [Roseovarius sp. Pro17]